MTCPERHLLYQGHPHISSLILTQPILPHLHSLNIGKDGSKLNMASSIISSLQCGDWEELWPEWSNLPQATSHFTYPRARSNVVVFFTGHIVHQFPICRTGRLSIFCLFNYIRLLLAGWSQQHELSAGSTRERAHPDPTDRWSLRPFSYSSASST